MRLIDADKLLTEFKERDEAAKRWHEAAKDEEIKIRAAATLDFLTEVKLTIEKAPTIEWRDIELMGYINGEQITKIKPSKIEGHWKEHNFKTCGGLGDWDYECSICENVYCGKHNYCPNCGAKMKGE